MTTHFNNLKNHSQAISIVEYHGIENFGKREKNNLNINHFGEKCIIIGRYIK